MRSLSIALLLLGSPVWGDLAGLIDQAITGKPPPPRPPCRDQDPCGCAIDEYVHGNYQRAAELARSGLEADTQKCWRMLGASACFLKDVATVREACGHLGNMDRQFIRHVCDTNQVYFKCGGCTGPTVPTRPYLVGAGALALSRASYRFNQGDWEKAVELAASPYLADVQQAWSIRARSSCRLGDQVAASRAVSALECEDERASVVSYCAAAGIQIVMTKPNGPVRK